jgi:hypothetical protein
MGRHHIRHGEDPPRQAEPEIPLQPEWQTVVCLDIPDDYEFMDPDLVRMLESRVGRFLPRTAPASDER